MHMHVDFSTGQTASSSGFKPKSFLSIKLEDCSTFKHNLCEKMLSLSYFFSLFLVINIAVVVVLGADKFGRDDFPPGFVFGSGTSVYQVSLLINGFILSF